MGTRAAVIAAVLTAGSLLYVGVKLHSDLRGSWKMLGVPPSDFPFTDTRIVTQSMQCAADGLDAYDLRFCQPLKTPISIGPAYDYPSIWLNLRYLGLGPRSTAPVALTMLAIFVLSLILLFKARTWLGRGLVFFGVLSRPIFFASERGNNDLAIFALLVFGYFAIERLHSRHNRLFTAGWIAALTALKIYPIVSAVVFVRRRRGIQMAALSVLFSVSALFVISGDSAVRALKNTPFPKTLSYGALPFFFKLSAKTSLQPIIEDHQWLASVGATCLLLAVGFVAVHWATWIHGTLPALELETARGRIAASGLAIFCSTFVAGASWNYRLMFLLGPLAYLVRVVERGSRRAVILGIVFIAILWMPIYGGRGYIEQSLDGLAFVIAGMWLSYTLLARNLHFVENREKTAPTPSIETRR